MKWQFEPSIRSIFGELKTVVTRHEMSGIRKIMARGAIGWPSDESCRCPSVVSAVCVSILDLACGSSIFHTGPELIALLAKYRQTPSPSTLASTRCCRAGSIDQKL